MRNIISLLFGLLVLTAPTVCAAESSTTWNLMNQKQVEGWNANGFDNAQLIDEGFAIKSNAPGQIMKVSKIRHAVDRIGISYITPTGASGQFFWRPKGMDGSEVYQIPLTFEPTVVTQKIILDMSQVSEWDARSDRIGFALDGGIEFVLQSIDFTGPTGGESLTYPFKTFIVLDRARPYSINFLWGPLMTYSKDQYLSLFLQIPPLGDS
ncbi:MAG: hypothetical protein QF815_01355, partial [Candidatus Peribacteraceae bacterium]|nr:hypothetical protein [Candidatus Peribacteraceae bacterium]